MVACLWRAGVGVWESGIVGQRDTNERTRLNRISMGIYCSL